MKLIPGATGASRAGNVVFCSLRLIPVARVLP